MSKDNQFAKKLTKQFLSINSLIESYFNSLNLFLQNLKKRKFINNNKVFLTFAVLLVLVLSYFSLPTFFDKNLIQSKIKNHISKKYNIDIKFNEEIIYTFFPKPHFSAKNVSIFRDTKNIANIKNFKILISVNNFFSFNNILVKDLILNKADFNLQIEDLSFFQDLLSLEPNENEILIKNSNIFFNNKDEEVLFINKIKSSKFFYDLKNFQNVFLSKNEIFNLPFKFSIKNDKFNKTIITNFNSKKIRLNVVNEINYYEETKKGILDIRLINKNTNLNYHLKKNSINFNNSNGDNSYKGVIDFKPFYFFANFSYDGLSTKNLLNDNSILIDLIKTEIFNNKNLNANINFNLKDITNINELNNLILKIYIQEGELNFSDTSLMWKKDLKIFFKETFLNYDDNEIKFIGKIFLNFKNIDNFYKSFQIPKNSRKKIDKVDFDFIYNLEKKTFSFDNVRIDGVENKNLKKYLDKFNLSKKIISNKIAFKNFVNNFFNAYAG